MGIVDDKLEPHVNFFNIGLFLVAESTSLIKKKAKIGPCIN